MKLSARNRLEGRVLSVKRGPVSTEVVVDIGAGKAITSTITSTAAEELGLAEGEDVHVVVKASNVMLMTD